MADPVITSFEANMLTAVAELEAWRRDDGRGFLYGASFPSERVTKERDKRRTGGWAEAERLALRCEETAKKLRGLLG